MQTNQYLSFLQPFEKLNNDVWESNSWIIYSTETFIDNWSSISIHVTVLWHNFLFKCFRINNSTGKWLSCFSSICILSFFALHKIESLILCERQTFDDSKKCATIMWDVRESSKILMSNTRWWWSFIHFWIIVIVIGKNWFLMNSIYRFYDESHR